MKYIVIGYNFNFKVRETFYTNCKLYPGELIQYGSDLNGGSCLVEVIETQRIDDHKAMNPAKLKWTLQ